MYATKSNSKLANASMIITYDFKLPERFWRDLVLSRFCRVFFVFDFVACVFNFGFTSFYKSLQSPKMSRVSAFDVGLHFFSYLCKIKLARFSSDESLYKIKVVPIHKWATYICSTESGSEMSKQNSSELFFTGSRFCPLTTESRSEDMTPRNMLLLQNQRS